MPEKIPNFMDNFMTVAPNNNPVGGGLASSGYYNSLLTSPQQPTVDGSFGDTPQFSRFLQNYTQPEVDYAVGDDLGLYAATADTAGPGNLGADGGSWTDIFTPNAKGVSTFSSAASGFGDVVKGISGLAGMYFAKKNMDLQKDQEAYRRGRDARQDAKQAQFAKNVGGGAM